MNIWLKAKKLIGLSLILGWIILSSACNGGVTLPGDTNPAPTTEVKITSPVEGAKVSSTETIKGTSQLISDDQKIWIIIFPLLANLYYPQDRFADMQANGEWTSVAYIGVEGDNVGEQFDIIVVLANANAQAKFENYLEEAKETGNWAGMKQLPEGAQIYDRITVERK